MNFFEAIVLGLVQALTEYLPVSSSAHIRILGDLMLGSDPGAAFTAIIQLGTELAVLLYFRRDIINILTAWFRCLFGHEGTDWRSRMGAGNKDARLGWYIILGTLPILISGLLFKDMIETTLRNLWITVTVLLVFGVLLWIVDAKSRQIKTMEEMTAKDAFIFGLGQMLALIPGVSRSGGTITVGRAMGYTREAAVRVSFLMAIPAVFGAGILETVSAIKDISAGDAGMFPGWGPTIVAAIVSFVVGYIVIIGFLKFVSTFSYKAFAIYRIALAVVVAILLIAGSVLWFFFKEKEKLLKVIAVLAPVVGLLYLIEGVLFSAYLNWYLNLGNIKIVTVAYVPLILIAVFDAAFWVLSLVLRLELKKIISSVLFFPSFWSANGFSFTYLALAKASSRLPN